MYESSLQTAHSTPGLKHGEICLVQYTEDGLQMTCTGHEHCAMTTGSIIIVLNKAYSTVHVIQKSKYDMSKWFQNILQPWKITLYQIKAAMVRCKHQTIKEPAVNPNPLHYWCHTAHSTSFDAPLEFAVYRVDTMQRSVQRRDKQQVLLYGKRIISLQHQARLL